MTVAKRQIPTTRAAAALSREEKRAAKLRVEQLVHKIGSLIQEKPETAQKAAAIVARWLNRG